MKFTVIFMTLLLASIAAADWSENFDSYANGSGIIGQGGWEGWDGNPAWEAYVTDAQSLSAPHSIDIEPTSDVVQEFNITSGEWTITAWNYIPTGSTGNQFFILLTLYMGGDSDWALQLVFNSDTDQVVVTEGTGTAAIIYDTWVEVKVEIDLTANMQNIYYNGVLLDTIQWGTGGFIELDALDLFSNGGSSIYWDNIELIETSGALTPSTWAAIKTSLK
ncbi:MAG: hypothetical protein K8S62_14040 [Candidatus Sabulitectum sp.]|nr:hypothetical protein [Candidatus Sabulitectum sp.]